MPQTIAICSKGGTGKIMVAALLGLEVAAARRKVILIDADPPMSQAKQRRMWRQAFAERWLGWW